MAEILVVDDEKGICQLVKNSLQKDGHNVTAYEAAERVPIKTIGRYDLIILDVMMAGMDGFTFCKRIRNFVDCPIIFLTAKSMENDVTFGFGIGGDDYLVKPFRLSELRARVNAHIRRERREKHNSLIFENGIKIDLQAKKITADGENILFTKAEYEICEYLARNKGQVFTKEQIYEEIFGFDGESSSSTIATHIKNIRLKLKKCRVMPIETVWGIGYKWV